MYISFPYTTSKQFFALVVRRITLDDGEVSGGRRNRRHGDESVLAVVCVAVAPVAREISVGVVRKRRRIDVVVLVESVRRVGMRDRRKVAACTGGRRAVADRIVEIRVAAVARSASRHLGAFVVRPCARGGLRISSADWPSKRVVRHSCRFTMTRQCRSGKSAASPIRNIRLPTSSDTPPARPPHAAPARFY